MAQTSYDYIDTEIKKKRDYAILHYMINNNVAKKGSAEVTENEKLNVILKQIEVCEGMLLPLGTSIIVDWLENKTIDEIEREARTIKFAS